MSRDARNADRVIEFLSSIQRQIVDHVGGLSIDLVHVAGDPPLIMSRIVPLDFTERELLAVRFCIKKTLKEIQRGT